jgi:hypothetical protein
MLPGVAAILKYPFASVLATIALPLTETEASFYGRPSGLTTVPETQPAGIVTLLAAVSCKAA